MSTPQDNEFSGFLNPKLTEWLDWVTGKEGMPFVALPMIQRGSVWKNNQIIALWDSLLRGMPVGSLMLSELKATGSDGKPTKVRRLGSSELIDVPANGGYSLLDGQQRTLAMLLGWLEVAKDGVPARQLWIDLADKPAVDHLFRFHMTSAAHPYGFTREDPNSKLTLSQRREARKSNQSTGEIAIKNNAQFPWVGKLPLPFIWLLKQYLTNKSKWSEIVLDELRKIKHREKTLDDDDFNKNVADNIKILYQSFNWFEDLNIPLIKIPERCFSEEKIEDAGAEPAPALAILFKRVGTGGTALSNADYIYSVIKHHIPESYELVETIAAQKGFSQLLGATDIVMTALRIVVAEAGGTDYENPSQLEFNNLRKNDKLLNEFLSFISNQRLSKALIALTEVLQYNEFNNKNGLPLLGFGLTSRPILQIILRWLLLATNINSNLEFYKNTVLQSREEILRFIAYAKLSFLDSKKASSESFKWLQKKIAIAPEIIKSFPGHELIKYLIALDKDLTYEIPSLTEFENWAITKQPDTSRPIRGSERFELNDTEPKLLKQKMIIFHRWWGLGSYRHSLLLWLQRHYTGGKLVKQNDIRTSDETPYDYDHICPSSHWSGWTGVTSKDRILDFSKSRGHSIIGNGIGNLRVWFADDNRSDGDKPAAVKLLNAEAACNVLLKDSAISEWQWADWAKASPATTKGKESVWDFDRSATFQRVVEQRTFDLYKRFYNELEFDKWFPLELDSSEKIDSAT